MNEKTKNQELRYKHQLEMQKIKQLRIRVSHLKKIVNVIRRNDLLSSGACDILEKIFSGLPLALMKRILVNLRKGKTIRRKYDDLIRSFAMTLHFYSSKGFTVKAEVADYKTRGQSVLCPLMFDEMSIKKHIFIDLFTGTYWGYANVGASVMEDNRRQYATEAFILMVVTVNTHWELPIADFFIYGLNTEERANIVKEAL